MTWHIGSHYLEHGGWDVDNELQDAVVQFFYNAWIIGVSGILDTVP
jgi:hypothetical protein